MSYPTLEQYNEAFQSPALTLVDTDLKKATITATGLGLPLALCGGFALTYTATNGRRKYAVRCFHKQSNALEQRYRGISSRLKTLSSPYFVDFEFQPCGVRVNGTHYPVVKMAWASGETLGEFLEAHYRKPSELQQLNSSLRTLAAYLEREGLAHGDIQPGNVMVSNGGKSVQLIDYDGMYVEDLRSLGSAELGHRNFQHPKRAASTWDPRLDRFSFIALNVATRALEAYPDLWSKTQSDGDSILFKANDFADPGRSEIFNDLLGRPLCADAAKDFAAICKAPFDATPRLEDFLARNNIPQVANIPSSIAAARAQYLSAFPVLDALQYALCLPHVGDRVELIGKIVGVKEGKSRYGKPYVFINFGLWKGQILKINIWSEGLAAIADRPNESWIGRWVSVIGLLEPPYRNQRFNYSHLAISVSQPNQLHIISEAEAVYRLGDVAPRSVSSTSRSTNQEILDVIRASPNSSASSKGSPVRSLKTVPRSNATQNQAVLRAIKSSQSPASQQATAPQPSNVPKSPPAAAKGNSRCFVATAVYGPDAPETKALRAWRERVLMTSKPGRALVTCYYLISPTVVPLLVRSQRLSIIVRAALDRFIERLEQR